MATREDAFSIGIHPGMNSQAQVVVVTTMVTEESSGALPHR